MTAGPKAGIHALAASFCSFTSILEIVDFFNDLKFLENLPPSLLAKSHCVELVHYILDRVSVYLVSVLYKLESSQSIITAEFPSPKTTCCSPGSHHSSTEELQWEIPVWNCCCTIYQQTSTISLELFTDIRIVYCRLFSMATLRLRKSQLLLLEI